MCTSVRDAAKTYVREANNFRFRIYLNHDYASRSTGLHVSKHAYNCTPKENKFTLICRSTK